MLRSGWDFNRLVFIPRGFGFNGGFYVQIYLCSDLFALGLAMTFTPALLHQHLPSSAQRIWVGLSGGLDSVVLLHALVQLRLPVPLLALHVNHQISPHAVEWQQHCAQMCTAWGIEFVTEAVTVELAGRGLEDAARAARGSRAGRVATRRCPCKRGEGGRPGRARRGQDIPAGRNGHNPLGHPRGPPAARGCPPRRGGQLSLP